MCRIWLIVQGVHICRRRQQTEHRSFGRTTQQHQLIGNDNTRSHCWKRSLQAQSATLFRSCSSSSSPLVSGIPINACSTISKVYSHSRTNRLRRIILEQLYEIVIAFLMWLRLRTLSDTFRIILEEISF